MLKRIFQSFRNVGFAYSCRLLMIPVWVMSTTPQTLLWGKKRVFTAQWCIHCLLKYAYHDRLPLVLVSCFIIFEDKGPCSA
jgi:hypothetical protein